jgi:hypothetical protein
LDAGLGGAFWPALWQGGQQGGRQQQPGGRGGMASSTGPRGGEGAGGGAEGAPSALGAVGELAAGAVATPGTPAAAPRPAVAAAARAPLFRQPLLVVGPAFRAPHPSSSEPGAMRWRGGVGGSRVTGFHLHAAGVEWWGGSGWRGQGGGQREPRGGVGRRGWAVGWRVVAMTGAWAWARRRHRRPGRPRPGRPPGPAGPGRPGQTRTTTRTTVTKWSEGLNGGGRA